MSFYNILSTVHGGAAILLFSLAIISILIPLLIVVIRAAGNANEGLVKTANAVGLFEIIVASILALTGVIAVFMSSWPWSQLWLWMGLVIMVVYIALLGTVTKSARLAAAKDGSAVKVALLYGLRMGHVLLLLVAFVLMIFKPI